MVGLQRLNSLQAPVSNLQTFVVLAWLLSMGWSSARGQVSTQVTMDGYELLPPNRWQPMACEGDDFIGPSFGRSLPEWQVRLDQLQQQMDDLRQCKLKSKQPHCLTRSSTVNGRRRS